MTKIEKVQLVVALVLLSLALWLVLFADRNDIFQIEMVAALSFCIAAYMLLKRLPTPEQYSQNLKGVIMKNKIEILKDFFTGVLAILIILCPLVVIGYFIYDGVGATKQEVNQIIDNQFNERISSGNCVVSGTEEIWKSGDVDVIIVKKYNCADGSILKRDYGEKPISRLKSKWHW